MKTTFMLTAGLMLLSTPVMAQGRELNGFAFSAPFNADPGFIENRFGFKQIVMTDAPIGHDTTAFTLGEQIAIDIKLHDYVGVSGKFVGSFQAGGSSIGEDYHFATGYNIRADGNINIKLFRNEKIGTQWIFHAKTSYRKNNGMFGDTAGIAIELDDEYYKSLVFDKDTKPEDVADHFKDDLKKSLKKSLEQLSVSHQATYVGGGGAISCVQTFNHNLALQASYSLMIGQNTIKVGDVTSSPIQTVEHTASIAGYVSLDPISPIMFRMEYEHEVFQGSDNNLVVGSLIFNKKAVPVNVTASAGKYFIGDAGTPIGSVAVDFYF